MTFEELEKEFVGATVHRKSQKGRLFHGVIAKVEERLAKDMKLDTDEEKVFVVVYEDKDFDLVEALRSGRYDITKPSEPSEKKEETNETQD